MYRLVPLWLYSSNAGLLPPPHYITCQTYWKVSVSVSSRTENQKSRSVSSSSCTSMSRLHSCLTYQWAVTFGVLSLSVHSWQSWCNICSSINVHYVACSKCIVAKRIILLVQSEQGNTQPFVAESGWLVKNDSKPLTRVWVHNMPVGTQRRQCTYPHLLKIHSYL